MLTFIIVILAILGCQNTSLFETPQKPAKPIPSKVSCSSCHPFPAVSESHQFHLNQQAYSSFNGVISCSDCHFSSLQTQKGVHLKDTAYFPIPHQDPAYQEWSPPNPNFEELRKFIQEIKQYDESYSLPVKTKAHHFNGRVDVQLAPNTVSPQGSPWNPQKKSCSSISCHSNPEDEYPWRLQ